MTHGRLKDELLCHPRKLVKEEEMRWCWLAALVLAFGPPASSGGGQCLKDFRQLSSEPSSVTLGWNYTCREVSQHTGEPLQDVLFKVKPFLMCDDYLLETSWISFHACTTI